MKSNKVAFIFLNEDWIYLIFTHLNKISHLNFAVNIVSFIKLLEYKSFYGFKILFFKLSYSLSVVLFNELLVEFIHLNLHWLRLFHFE